MSLDFQAAEERYVHEPEDDRTPDRLFQQQRVLALLDRVFTRLQGEYDATGKHDQFDRLSPFITGQTERLTHSQVSQSLGITEQAARAAAYRLRKRYRELLREEIAQTVASEDEVDDEVRALFSAFRS